MSVVLDIDDDDDDDDKRDGSSLSWVEQSMSIIGTSEKSKKKQLQLQSTIIIIKFLKR